MNASFVIIMIINVATIIVIITIKKSFKTVATIYNHNYITAAI